MYGIRKTEIGRIDNQKGTYFANALMCVSHVLSYGSGQFRYWPSTLVKRHRRL
jgi:hypothetical protein